MQRFFAEGTEKRLAKGEILLIPQESATAPISYLVEGRVIQYDIDDEGNKAVLNMFKPGAFFPLPIAVNKSPVLHFFEAATPVVVKQMSSADVEKFLRREPDVAYDVLSRMYRGLEGVLGRMSLLLRGDAKSRVLYELIILEQRFGEQSDEGTRIKVTERELAEMTGLTRETISRVLQTLQHEGVVVTHRGSVTIL